MSFNTDNELNPNMPFIGDKNFEDNNFKLAMKFYPNVRDIFSVYGDAKFVSPTNVLADTNLNSLKIVRGN